MAKSKETTRKSTRGNGTQKMTKSIGMQRLSKRLRGDNCLEEHEVMKTIEETKIKRRRRRRKLLATKKGGAGKKNKKSGRKAGVESGKTLQYEESKWIQRSHKPMFLRSGSHGQTEFLTGQAYAKNFILQTRFGEELLGGLLTKEKESGEKRRKQNEESDNVYPVVDKNEKQWEVEKIVECQYLGGIAQQYLVLWKGYSVDTASWIKANDMTNCRGLIEDFEEIVTENDESVVQIWKSEKHIVTSVFDPRIHGKNLYISEIDKILNPIKISLMPKNVDMAPCTFFYLEPQNANGVNRFARQSPICTYKNRHEHQIWKENFHEKVSAGTVDYLVVIVSWIYYSATLSTNDEGHASCLLLKIEYDDASTKQKVVKRVIGIHFDSYPTPEKRMKILSEGAVPLWLARLCGLKGLSKKTFSIEFRMAINSVLNGCGVVASFNAANLILPFETVTWNDITHSCHKVKTQLNRHFQNESDKRDRKIRKYSRLLGWSRWIQPKMGNQESKGKFCGSWVQYEGQLYDWERPLPLPYHEFISLVQKTIVDQRPIKPKNWRQVRDIEIVNNE